MSSCTCLLMTYAVYGACTFCFTHAGTRSTGLRPSCTTPAFQVNSSYIAEMLNAGPCTREASCSGSCVICAALDRTTMQSLQQLPLCSTSYSRPCLLWILPYCCPHNHLVTMLLQAAVLDISKRLVDHLGPEGPLRICFMGVGGLIQWE